jgi:hypothetical protein
MPRSLRVAYYLILVLLVSSMLSWFILGKLWFISSSLIIAHLEQTLPWIEDQRLSAYRNQSWCKTIAYQAGAFSETKQPKTCNLFDGESLPFSSQARADFQALRQKLRVTGARVAFINAYYSSDSLQSVEFNLNCLWCPRTRYVFEPNYALPEDLGGEIWYQPVNQDWYQMSEEWN